MFTLLNSVFAPGLGAERGAQPRDRSECAMLDAARDRASRSAASRRSLKERALLLDVLEHVLHLRRRGWVRGCARGLIRPRRKRARLAGGSAPRRAAGRGECRGA